ncbi:MAG TPA: TPM domain-containing protein, partial [Vicinamibacteria bacterium]|nr:TPM domain-containing protein [Vicinamibacteria bacterium]
MAPPFTLLLFAVLLATPGAAADQETAPELLFLPVGGHFHDVGGVISEPVRERLDARLADLESRTGHRVHVLVLASLTGGLDRLPDTVSVAAQRWKIGRDRAHAGVLFVYAQDMDLLHVDTLLGAEIKSVENGIGDLLQSVARLQGAGDQDGAFERAVSGIGDLLEGREPPPPPSPRASTPGAADGGRATGYVVDGAGVLSPATVEGLNAALHQHEQETSNQVVVHTIPSLAGETIETYSLRLATKLGAGQKDKDNGVLLLVARDDRKVRIEVGYGLEGALPDVLCARIIREEIVPRFKQGDMDGGVAAGVDRILGAIRGE